MKITVTADQLDSALNEVPSEVGLYVLDSTSTYITDLMVLGSGADNLWYHLLDNYPLTTYEAHDITSFQVTDIGD
jgi:hypothetical protein